MTLSYSGNLFKFVVFFLGKLGNREILCKALENNKLHFPEIFPISEFSQFIKERVIPIIPMTFSLQKARKAKKVSRVLRENVQRLESRSVNNAAYAVVFTRMDRLYFADFAD